jgi:hypothetical protein
MRLAKMLERLACLPPDMDAEFITETGITDVTGAELANWAMQRQVIERLPGVGMASGRGQHILVLLPPEVAP